MKLIELQPSLRERVARTAHAKFGVTLDSVPSETPPRTALGDLAFPVAFDLARRIKQTTGEKKNPRQIADELAEELRLMPYVARVEVAGAGYINVFYDRATLLIEAAIDESVNDSRTHAGHGSSKKSIIEHTNINPNKAAHIGHLRNAVLGDTFVRLLRAAGETVEVQNYIDNTGVQVADVVVGFMHVENMTLDDVKRVDATLPPDTSFDYYCWDLYARVGLYYRGGTGDGAEMPERLALRAQALHDIEAGDNPTAKLADYVATRIVEQHLKTMARLDIKYDVLPRESEILQLKFWDSAFERLKASGAVRLETEGRHAGCWVMPLETQASTDEHEADKIIVRSNGTVTYAGKDIAYQLWKLGRLDKDFYYRPFFNLQENDNHQVWMTTSEPTTNDAPRFGNGATIYNVIDSRQSYTQDVVKRGVAAVAPEIGQAASVHLSYEMVALSPSACEELGLKLSDADKARPYIEMSGRKGLGVKADDLIDRLEAKTYSETLARNTETPEDERRLTAHQVAIGALRYFLLKWTRNSVIAFDFTEALSLKGETGPYCQYAAIRANSLFRKLDADAILRAQALLTRANDDAALREKFAAYINNENGTDLWTLWSLAARLDEVIGICVRTHEPTHLAKYAFELAQGFNAFYDNKQNRVLEESDEARRALLITVAAYTRAQLTRALATLGIDVPTRM